MIGKRVPLVIIILLALVACSDKKSPNPVSSESFSVDNPLGSLVLNITVAPWNPILAKNAAVQAMDSVKVLVYSSTGSKLIEQRLVLNGTRWQGSINVTAQNSMKVVLAYFGASTVRYLGEKTGVNVTAGGSTSVDITVNYMGPSIASLDSAGADFKVRWTSRPLATKYELEQDTKADFSTATNIYSGTDTTYTVQISGKTAGQKYYYRVRVNTTYGYGPWYSKSGASTAGNVAGTVIIGAQYLPVQMVQIPGGTFKMGDVEGVNYIPDEKPVHTVTVSSFQMSETEITNAQYCAWLNAALASGDITVTGTTVSGKKGAYISQDYIYLSNVNDANNRCWVTYSNNVFSVVIGHENWPVVYVTWYGSKVFAEYFGWDLAREAEWEYACRGGKQNKYGTDDGTISKDKANYLNNGPNHPVNVKSYPKNSFGLYDMSGNVWEWCADWYGSYSSLPVIDPTGAPIGSYRVLRGGSLNGSDIFCRSAAHTILNPASGSFEVGFRVVRR